MKKKWFTIMGIALGMAVCISGCEKKTQRTIGGNVKAEEGKKEESEKQTEELLSEVIEEDMPEILYDFEDSEVVNRGSGEIEQAELVNHAYCIRNENGEGVLELTGGKDSLTSPYLSLPAGVFDNVSEMTISANVQINGSDKDYYLFLLGNSNMRHFAVSIDRNSITTSFCAANGAEEKKGTAEFPEKRMGQWIHVVVTVRNSAEDYIAETYVDGELVSSFGFGGYALIDIGKKQECSMGKPIKGSSYFDGCIADFCAWFHAMDAEEIKGLHDGSNIWPSSVN